MSTLARRLWEEPALFLAALAAALNAVQVAAVAMPAWAHALVAVASILLAGAGTRQVVAPMTREDPTDPELLAPERFKQ